MPSPHKDGALISRPGKASGKGRAKPGMALLASAGAGAAAVAMRRRRNAQAAAEPLAPESVAPPSDTHEGEG